MSGFFSYEDTNQINTHKSIVPSCGACGLHKKCQSPKMGHAGEGRKGVLVLAEAPGRSEDAQGEHFIGEAGKYVQSLFRVLGRRLSVDCWGMYVINCRPSDEAGHNRQPTDAEISYCHPLVWQTIQKLKPKVILCLGPSALKSVFNGRKDSPGPIARWRGFVIPDREAGCWVIPTFHPSFLIKNEHKMSAEVTELLFKQDIELAFNMASEPFPYRSPGFEDEKRKIEPLSERDACLFMRSIMKEANIKDVKLSFDYETTGLKPDAEYMKILSCSISKDGESAHPFMMTERTALLLRDVLSHQRIKKIAANLKYEERWSRAKLGVRVANWYWDTTLAAHFLDNRQGITSVAFQSHILWGVYDYDSHLDTYKTSKDGNSKNKMEELDEHTLLTYNGLDTMFEFRMFQEQVKSKK